MTPLRRLVSAELAVSSDEVAAAILHHGLLELGALAVSLWLIDRTQHRSSMRAERARCRPASSDSSIPIGADLPALSSR